ncbi:hypothetical protein [Xanthomonas arboricola]|uniref:hypothetical protein n=1 Tax=Xanthomonas arboricola TaxID=56448 RepID=UPI001EE6CA99|nr:hypothetical protein [Xanthomonas arboricola]
MPYNILLLPLLAGYLFLSRSRLRAYSTARLPKDQLLLAAALLGFIFLLVSRLICYLVLQADWGRYFAQSLHKVAPFDFIGTALGTLLLSGLLISFVNTFVSENVAGFWLYHRRELDPLTRVLWSSVVGVEPRKPPGGLVLTWTLAVRMLRFLRVEIGFKRLLRTPLREYPKVVEVLRAEGLQFSGLDHGEARTAMINMKDGRVIVGYTFDLLTNNPNIDFVTISPLWTGYRDGENRVLKVVDYTKAFEDASEKPGDSPDPKSFARVIRSSEIISASVFSGGAFKIPDLPQQESQASTNDRVGIVAKFFKLMRLN